MAKQKRYLPMPLFLLSVVVVGLSIWAVIVRTRAPVPAPLAINEVTPTGTVTLAFGTASSPLLANTSSTIPVTIATGTSFVTAATIVISYDPATVTITSVAQGDFFTNSIGSTALTSGRAAFTYTVPTQAGAAKRGSGTVATLSVKPLTMAPFTLTFGTGTLVAATNATGNVLKTANPHIFTPFTIPGDFNNDKIVNLFDYNLLVSKWGNPYTLFDYNNLVANWGKTSP